MDLTTWLVFLGSEIVLSLVPGPAVLFVIANGLRSGTRAAMLAGIGTLLANACYFLLSALGVAAVLVAVPGLLTTLRWLGALYVAWLGVMALRAPAVAIEPAANAAADRPLQRGFRLQLANPKALLFFASILPGFVDVDSPDAWPAWLQIAVFGVTSVGTEVWVLFGYGALAAAASARVRDPRWLRRLDQGAGIVLLCVAVWLVL